MIIHVCIAVSQIQNETKMKSSLRARGPWCFGALCSWRILCTGRTGSGLVLWSEKWWFKVKTLYWCFYQTRSFSLKNILLNGSAGVVWICALFLSAVWTLILTVPGEVWTLASWTLHLWEWIIMSMCEHMASDFFPSRVTAQRAAQ